MSEEELKMIINLQNKALELYRNLVGVLWGALGYE